MQVETIALLTGAPGTEHRLRVLRYGPPDGPKAFIQAALHADEVPALLVAQALRRRFDALDAAGVLRGPVLLLPSANPIGLAQTVLGQHQGRFAVADGVNFNRGYADLGAAAAEALTGHLSGDPAADTARVRRALAAAAHQLQAETPAQDLKNRLLQLACDASVVLDLHCDNDAVMHLYALTPQAAEAAELGALLGARALLLATESGDSPFDEACTRPWLTLQQRFPDAALPLGCFAATVELRGEADTSHADADRDADAIVEFLRRRGIVGGALRALPPPLCEPTPLAGSDAVTAPRAGVVVFHAAPGDVIAAGQTVADLVDIDSGAVLPLPARASGVLYARTATRWAIAGTRVARIAGSVPIKSGKLLGP